MMKKLYRSAGARMKSAVNILCLFALAGSASVHGATVIDVQTAFGFMRLDLYEDQAPEIAAQFLDNVNSGVYDVTMVHWAQGGMLRGGLFRFNSCNEGPVEAAPGVRHPLTLNNLDNDFGTIALRRDPLNSGQLSNEWQFNLASGVEDDGSDSAPVVFGRIIGGMGIADAIHLQPRVALGTALPNIPTINLQYAIETYDCQFMGRDNIIFVTMDSREVVNVYDAASDQIQLQVDAGEAGYLQLAFVIESASEGTIRALSESVVVLTEAVAGMANFDAETGELYIPEIAIGDDIPFVNALFQLTDAENLIFTLQSVDDS